MTAPQMPAAPAAPVGGAAPGAPQSSAAPVPCAGDSFPGALQAGTSAAPPPADLTPREQELLDFLQAHPGQVFTRRALLAAVWGIGADLRTRTVDQHVAALRRKCGLDDRLLTVYRQGYLYQAG